MIILHNDEFIDESDFRISPSDRGLTLGDGVFDTLLAQDGVLVWAEEHFERLVRHASIFGMTVENNFEDKANDLIKKNNFTAGRYAVRTTITRGVGTRGLIPPENTNPAVIMRATPVPEEFPPVYAVVSETVRRNEGSPLSRIKSLNYGDNILALMEAKNKGANESLLLNNAGNITCATTGNIFILEGKQLVTPPLSDGVLDGITRKKFMEEQDVREENIAEKRLLKAETIYLTNSIKGIQTVARLNGQSFKKAA